MTTEEVIRAHAEKVPVIMNLPTNFSIFIEFSHIDDVSFVTVRGGGVVASCRLTDASGTVYHVRADDLRRKE